MLLCVSAAPAPRSCLGSEPPLLEQRIQNNCVTEVEGKVAELHGPGNKLLSQVDMSLRPGKQF